MRLAPRQGRLADVWARHGWGNHSRRREMSRLLDRYGDVVEGDPAAVWFDRHNLEDKLRHRQARLEVADREEEEEEREEERREERERREEEHERKAAAAYNNGLQRGESSARGQYYNGYGYGDQVGYSRGRGHGWGQGYGDGYGDGYEDGDEDGFDRGYGDGYEDADDEGDQRAYRSWRKGVKRGYRYGQRGAGRWGGREPEPEPERERPRSSTQKRIGWDYTGRGVPDNWHGFAETIASSDEED
ncbi:hypothetical protein MMC13_006473 [Lambiella insularis]|nr:hypothetical protein [Lambiella insularis]